MPAKRAMSPLSYTQDTYFPNDMSYTQADNYAPYLKPNEHNSSRSKDQYYRNMPPPACSRTLSHDSLTYPNGSSTTDMHMSADAQHYYATPASTGLIDLPPMYDVIGNQYPRDYFDPSGPTLPNTPLETPSFTHTPMQAFDMSYTTHNPNIGMPDRQSTWDSRWKSLFDVPKAQSVQSLSPTASQPRQPSQSDSGLLATEFEASRRQSTDTGSTSTKSIRSGNNPVSTVLAHHVYGVLNGEQAWNVIKHLQQAEIVRDVWSEVATLAHPDKAPEARESPLWEQIASGKIPLNLHELSSQDLVLVFSGLAILAKRAASLEQETSNGSGGPDPLKVFIESHEQR